MAGQDENDLYARWRAEPGNRRDTERKLYAAVKRHAQAVLWQKLEETPDELVDKVTTAVMTHLGKFRQNSKFSTWVHATAQNKAKEYARSQRRKRKVFDESVAVVESYEEDALDKRIGEVTPSVLPRLEEGIAAKELLATFSEEDTALLQYKRDGLDSKQIAEAMGTSVEAVDSRWARLKPKVKKSQFTRRKQMPSGN